MRKLLLSTYLFLSIFVSAQAQMMKCTFTHYSSENGLSQDIIMDMLQDKRGIMWFATWDGINRFDGYEFQTFKARQGDLISLTNNRVDFLAQDKYGFIWAVSYDDKVHRLDPEKESFIHVPQDRPAADLHIIHMVPLSNGDMWLLTANDGAVRAVTDPQNGFSVSTQWYSTRSGLLSTNKVSDVYLDKSNDEWILTDNGLGLIRKGNVKPTMFLAGKSVAQKQHFYAVLEIGNNIVFTSNGGKLWIYNMQSGHFSMQQLPTASDITIIKLIQNDEMVLGTKDDGFFIFSLHNRSVSHYNMFTDAALPSNKISHIYVDSHKEIWLDLGNANGVTHFNPFNHRVKQELVPVELNYSSHLYNPYFHAHEDVNGYLWIQPKGGGFSYYDRKADKLVPFYDGVGSPDYRFSSMIHSIMSDRQGNLWLCTYSKGLEKITFSKSQFQIIPPGKLAGESIGNDTRALCQDSEGNLWVGTKDGTVYLYNREMKKLGYLTANGAISNTGKKLEGAAYFITQNHNGVMWIATKGEGLIKAKKISNRYILTRYKHSGNDIYSLSDDKVYCVYEDRFHRLWVASYGGGINYIEQCGGDKVRFINHGNNLKNYPQNRCFKVRYITSDYLHHICVATTAGMVVFNDDFKHPEDIHFAYYRNRAGDKTALGNNDVHWIYSNRKYGTYLATFGGGLNKLISADAGRAAFKCYTVKDGLLSDVLLSIQEDKQGYLWISSESGISRFDPKTLQFENYTDNTFPCRAQFNEATSVRLQSGAMAFGTNCGIFYFDPAKARKSTYAPYIYLSDLQINNKPVSPLENNKDSILTKDVEYLKQLKLKHNKNTISIRFAALDYRDASNIKYAYKLEGFDNEWNYVDKQRQATYTNLPKGHYVFMVKSTNSDGVWTNNIRRLDITVLPSFWETPWAYILYLMIIVIVILSVTYVLFTFYKLKNEVSVEQRISDIKLRFFTDISHELRTPLTLISGPVEMILHDEKDLNGHIRGQLLLVKKNVDRMLRLVNQIIDFRKIQNNKMKMRVSDVAIAPFIERIKENFDTLAEEHNIEYTFENNVDGQHLWVDIDKVEKIVFNLLSNAFKYTPKDKCINVMLYDEDETIAVAVKDQGIGIEESKRSRLFNRFETLVDKSLFNSPSSGIGLSLVKQLADMHHATITVDSKEGEGSCFTVHFLKGKEHYGDGVEFILTDLSSDIQENLSKDEQYVSSEVNEVSGEEAKPSVLIVEDNVELRSLLRSVFASQYQVYEAGDGQKGFDMACEVVPDIIISDVMMPVMDGVEMTKRIRDDLRTSHIPLILLTAKIATDSKLEGMEIGADDYITKPFSTVYLKARVENMLKRRTKLCEFYKQHFMDLSTFDGEEAMYDGMALSHNDRKFLNDLGKMMEKNLDNGDLVVNDLVNELAVSRSVLFKKLKNLLNMSPIEYIKNYRVKSAAKLIDTGDYNMTQIAYMVGINDPRYFSRCFKQYFNMTPTEYKEKLNKRKI